MNYVPSVETVRGKLEHRMKLYAGDEMRVMDDALRAAEARVEALLIVMAELPLWKLDDSEDAELVLRLRTILDGSRGRSCKTGDPDCNWPECSCDTEVSRR